jgi:hypothetical protein
MKLPSHMYGTKHMHRREARGTSTERQKANFQKASDKARSGRTSAGRAVMISLVWPPGQDSLWTSDPIALLVWIPALKLKESVLTHLG